MFLLLSAAAAAPLHGAERVTVDIAPLADIVSRIGGDDLEVITLYPAGSGPPSTPLPDDTVRRASGSRLYFRTGAGLAGKSDDQVVHSATGRIRVVDIASGMRLIGPSKPEETERRIFDAALGLDGKGGGWGGNPWFWLDPRLVTAAVDTIVESLAGEFPGRRAAFEIRAEDLRKRLEKLDREIEERLAPIGDRRFAAFSGVASYFCRRYGFDEIPVTGVAPGGSPERTSLRGTVLRLRALGVPAAFTGPAFPRRPAEEAAARSGVSLVVIEPFGSPGRGGYFEMMRSTADLIRDALATP